MQIHLALYDPSFISSDRSYWTWRSSIIPASLLDECYYRFLIKKRPEKPEQIQNKDLFGGIVELQNWFVVYRFYNGGRDLHDRPGRYVILTGWIKRDDVNTCAPNAIFSLSVFETFALTPPCPVPQPDSLDIELSGTPVKRQSTAIHFSDGKYEFPIDESVESAVETFFSLNCQSDARQLTIIKTSKINHLAIELINNKASNVPPSHDQQDLSLEPQNRSGEFEQIDNSALLSQKENAMNYPQINLFNTCALIAIIILASMLFVQQISIQKQINNNSEVINAIQQELKSLHPDQDNIYYNQNSQPENNVISETGEQEQVWTFPQESTGTLLPEAEPQNIQPLQSSDPNVPSPTSFLDRNSDEPAITSEKEKETGL